jgi:two-component system, LuxR family, response regulator FixJ
MALEKAALSSVVHVIDDDEALRESLTFLLRSAGLDVQSYSSARAFIDALPGLTLSCVITDLRMPDMSGIEFNAASEEPQDRGASDRDYWPR